METRPARRYFFDESLLGTVNLTGAALATLYRLPKTQSIELRKDWDTKSFSLDSPKNTIALLAHRAGTINKVQCLNCQAGHGYFKSCVNLYVTKENGELEVHFKHACTNCKVGDEHTYCSFRGKNGGKIPASVVWGNGRHVGNEAMREQLKKNDQILPEPKGKKKISKGAIDNLADHTMTDPRYRTSENGQWARHSEFFLVATDKEPLSEYDRGSILNFKTDFEESVEHWALPALEVDDNGNPVTPRGPLRLKRALLVLREYYSVGTIADILLEGLDALEVDNHAETNLSIREETSEVLDFQAAFKAIDLESIKRDRIVTWQILNAHPLFWKSDAWEMKDMTNLLMFHFDMELTTKLSRLMGVDIPTKLNKASENLYKFYPRVGCEEYFFESQGGKAGSFTLELDKDIAIKNEVNFGKLITEMEKYRE